MRTRTLFAFGFACLLASSALAVGYRNSDPARPQPVSDRPVGENYDGRLDELTPTVTEIDPIELSFRFGLHEWNCSHDRTGIGTEVSLRMGHHSTPFDLLLTFHYADADYTYETGMGDDANMYKVAKAKKDGIERIDADGKSYGASLLIQWNLARWELVNPYLAAGLLYEESEFSSDYVLSSLGPEDLPGKNKFVTDDNGVAVVARAGLEFNPHPFHASADVSWISDVYGDDAQCKLAGSVGVKATADARVDLSGSYFTEWEEYYILLGVTLVR